MGNQTDGQKVAEGTPGATATALGDFQMYIDGEWVDARTKGLLEIVDPATEEVVARVANGGAEDAEAAVAAARRAFDEGPWPRTPAAERAAVLHAAAVLVRERVDEMARWESLEMGKLFSDGQGDISRVADLLDYAGDLAERLLADQPISEPTALVREPVGVVVGVCPWNFPLVLASFKFASALAAGNVVIIKPASISPLTALGMARIFDEVGLPKGVFQVVIGPGRSVGDYLVSSPLVDMVTLTGSVEVGRHIMTQAAKTVKKVGLELGGKAPNTVFADADLDAALDGVVFSAFGNCGQACCAGSRLLVERSIHESFVADVVARAEALRIGPGLDPASELSPLSSREQLEVVERYVAIGVEEGATLACGGERLEGKGFFYRPTVFVDVDNRMRIAQEEIFGPVLVVIPFDTEEEAIRIANDTVFGLTAGVWTSDTARARRYVRAVRAGTVFVNNTWACAPLGLPWGGYKQSGIGREIGDVGIEEFCELKAVIFAGA
jgi:betaine-aldehyde dehydrogenase